MFKQYRMTISFIFGLIALCTLNWVSVAIEPTCWRGDATGFFPQTKAPVSWSEEEGILWQTEMPAFSNASPIIVDGKLFVCAEVDQLVCIDLAKGEVLWTRATPEESLLDATEKARREKIRTELGPVKAEREKLGGEVGKIRRELRKDRDNEDLKARQEELNAKIAELDKRLEPLNAIEMPRAHKVNGYSSPTPTTDGKNIYVLFGTGVAAAYTPDGNRVWARVVQKPKHGWGHSSSPLLAGGKLVLSVIDVWGLDPATGADVWHTKSGAHWGSPIAAEVSGETVVVTCHGQVLRPADGTVLSDQLIKLDYNSPLVVGDVVYTFNTDNARAHKLTGTVAEKVIPEVLWETPIKKDRYYASPLLVEGVLYGITRNSVLTTVDATTGEKLYEKKLDIGKGTVYPSPTYAGGAIYISIDNGTTVVLKPGREYQEIGRNKLAGFRSSPIFVNDRLYIRALKQVYCISGGK